MQSIWLSRLATIPFLAAAIWLTSQLAREPLTRAVGSEVAARVDEVRPYKKRERIAAHTYDVTFSYDGGGVGRRRVGYDVVHTDGARPPEVGQAIAARVLRLGPWEHAELSDGMPAAPEALVCVGLFMAVWAGGALFFASAAWVGPVLHRRFVRDAAATVGTLTGKGVGGPRHVSYRYVSADGVERQGKAAVPPEVFERLSKGQALTVLYRADRPGESVPYDACDYEVTRRGRA
jgi:hypothetical protein